jgi:hypothetical protein
MRVRIVRLPVPVLCEDIHSIHSQGTKKKKRGAKQRITNTSKQWPNLTDQNNRSKNVAQLVLRIFLFFFFSFINQSSSLSETPHIPAEV